jgi:hypothetical protein
LPHGGQKVISVTPFKNSIHYNNPVENARSLKITAQQRVEKYRTELDSGG